MLCSAFISSPKISYPILFIQGSTVNPRVIQLWYTQYAVISRRCQLYCLFKPCLTLPKRYGLNIVLCEKSYLQRVRRFSGTLSDGNYIFFPKMKLNCICRSMIFLQTGLFLSGWLISFIQPYTHMQMVLYPLLHKPIFLLGN